MPKPPVATKVKDSYQNTYAPPRFYAGMLPKQQATSEQCAQQTISCELCGDDMARLGDNTDKPEFYCAKCHHSVPMFSVVQKFEDIRR
ncbi:MAG TPA: hypothetical protein VJ521_04505 [Acidobacteriota bacterium]|nr:hypothetical protein [Acidobacteriota bacterium]